MEDRGLKLKKWGEEVGIQPPVSVSDQIYEIIKKKILTCEIEPGERLMQEDVARLFRASRTPVREAFRCLEQDGLIERLAQGGVRVTTVDARMVEQVYGIRGALEAYGIELACERISSVELAELGRIRDQGQELLQHGMRREVQIQRFFEINSLFHETIYRATDDAYLLRIISNVRNTVLRMRSLGLRAEDTWRQAWEEHAQLIVHLERRDRMAAAELMRRHIVSAAANVVAGMKRSGKDTL